MTRTAIALAILILALSALPASGQGHGGHARPARIRPAPQTRPATPEELKERWAAKQKEPWLVDGGWILDYDRARETAREGDKLIVAYFSRSYSP